MRGAGVIAVILFAVILFLTSGGVCYASEGEILDEFESIIPPESNVSLTDGKYDVEGLGIGEIFKELIQNVGEQRGTIVSFFLMLVGLSALISMVDSSRAALDGEVMSSASVGLLTLASVSIFSSLFGLCESLKHGLESVVDFFSAAVPIMTAVNVAGGATASASVQAVNMNLTLGLIQKFCVSGLLPVSFAVFSISFIGSVSDNAAINGIGKGIRGFFMWGIGIVSTLLAATISIQSVVASAEDSAALRAARYAASGTIPVVGSTVASALATLGGGMAFIKSSVGGASIAVILSVTLSPLVILLLYRASFAICASFLEFSGSAGGVRCFSAFKSSLDALIAVYSMSVLVCIVELIVFIKGGALG